MFWGNLEGILKIHLMTFLRSFEGLFRILWGPFEKHLRTIWGLWGLWGLFAHLMTCWHFEDHEIAEENFRTLRTFCEPFDESIEDPLITLRRSFFVRLRIWGPRQYIADQLRNICGPFEDLPRTIWCTISGHFKVLLRSSCRLSGSFEDLLRAFGGTFEDLSRTFRWQFEGAFEDNLRTIWGLFVDLLSTIWGPFEDFDATFRTWGPLKDYLKKVWETFEDYLRSFVGPFEDFEDYEECEDFDHNFEDLLRIVMTFWEPFQELSRTFWRDWGSFGGSFENYWGLWWPF